MALVLQADGPDLIDAQRDHRIDAGRPARRQVAGERCNGQKDERHDEIGGRIGWAKLVQQAGLP